jgi:hypothetical protein
VSTWYLLAAHHSLQILSISTTHTRTRTRTHTHTHEAYMYTQCLCMYMQIEFLWAWLQIVESLWQKSRCSSHEVGLLAEPINLSLTCYKLPILQQMMDFISVGLNTFLILTILHSLIEFLGKYGKNPFWYFPSVLQLFESLICKRFAFGFLLNENHMACCQGMCWLWTTVPKHFPQNIYSALVVWTVMESCWKNFCWHSSFVSLLKMGGVSAHCTLQNRLCPQKWFSYFSCAHIAPYTNFRIIQFDFMH